MKALLAGLAALLLQDSGLATANRVSAPALNGHWSVDLSTDPAVPYRKPMVLALAPDGTVSGSFYDSEILAGHWSQEGERLCVAFRTADNAGPYHTSACLIGHEVSGQTWAEQRKFLFFWTAARPAD